MAKIVQRRCLRGYRHYFLPQDTSWDEPEPDRSQMRELLLVCARCSYHLWIDTIIRPYFGMKSDDDWGT